jgi:hypothetical protein
MTFAEAIASPDFHVMAKSRLKQIRDHAYQQLEAVL